MPQSQARARFHIALFSFAASLVIFGIKATAALMTGSSAVRADALESVVNIITALMALAAVKFAEQPADADHPYGHGKAEFFSALVEGVLIFGAAGTIAFDAVNSFFAPREIESLGLGMVMLLSAGLMNGALGFYLIKKGKALGSAALAADGEHVLSDFWTSLTASIGLGIVMLSGFKWVDPVVALGVAGWLGWTGIGLVRRSVAPLMDQHDPALGEELTRSLQAEREPGIIALHEMRAMRAGRIVHVDVHIVVPEFESVRTSHDQVEAFCARVLKRAGLQGEFHPHIDPCASLYCANCVVEPCPIRAVPFEKTLPWTADSVVQPGPDEV